MARRSCRSRRGFEPWRSPVGMSLFLYYIYIYIYIYIFKKSLLASINSNVLIFAEIFSTSPFWVNK